MKKFYLTVLATAFFCSANAQEQLDNNGFEDWETVSYGSKSGEEPVKWSSFLDGTGDKKSLAAAVQVQKSTEKRPGSEGSYSARINTRVISIPLIGKIPAQGNLTTGCVNMGSTTATDASGNYNYINHDRADQSMPFTGRPQKFSVWLKGSCQEEANVTIHLVSDGYYQDPVYQSRNKAKEIANAVLHVKPTNDWEEYTCDFNYLSDDAPQYVLVNISTSATPGKGNEKDVLYVDDLQMLYSEDGINEVTVSESASGYYNLSGQKVSPSKGIVIHNGKKMVIK